MSAEIETIMYVRDVPWHGLGTKLDQNVPAAVCIQQAGLDWDVETAPIVSDDQKRTGVDRYRMTRRVTDDAVLGIVKKGYVPIQNREAFSMFDGVIGAGRALYDTAGSLQGGSKVFIAAKMPGVLQVGPNKDEVLRYLLLSNSHDGTRPLQMIFTPVRVVCSNTLSLALTQEQGDGAADLRFAPRVTIRHSKKKKQALKEAERCMKRAFQYYEKFGDFAGFLASQQVDAIRMETIVGEVFPPNKKREVTPTILSHRMEVMRLFDEGEGHEKIAGTYWALLNAFTQYADHSYALRGAKEPGDRAYSALMGGARGLKQRATKVIAETVTA